MSVLYDVIIAGAGPGGGMIDLELLFSLRIGA